MVNRKKEVYASVFRMCITVGVTLCILSPVPVIMAALMKLSDFACVICVCVLLLMIGIATYLFVSTGMVNASYDKLLQQNEYTPEEKKLENHIGIYVSAYWCVATAVYLAWSFLSNDWHITWVVWVVAGILVTPYRAILRSKSDK